MSWKLAELYVDSSRRRYFVGVISRLVAFAAWNTYERWNSLPRNEAQVRFVAVALIILFAIWCAFAKETWHVDRNSIEHRVGVKAWAYRNTSRTARWKLCSIIGQDMASHVFAYVSSSKANVVS
jgi:hypothetical protein